MSHRVVLENTKYPRTSKTWVGVERLLGEGWCRVQRRVLLSVVFIDDDIGGGHVVSVVFVIDDDGSGGGDDEEGQEGGERPNKQSVSGSCKHPEH